jgi:hypothetical protein
VVTLHAKWKKWLSPLGWPLSARYWRNLVTDAWPPPALHSTSSYNATAAHTRSELVEQVLPTHAPGDPLTV